MEARKLSMEFIDMAEEISEYWKYQLDSPICL